jgi:hypothetical protein
MRCQSRAGASPVSTFSEVKSGAYPCAALKASRVCCKNRYREKRYVSGQSAPKKTIRQKKRAYVLEAELGASDIRVTENDAFEVIPVTPTGLSVSDAWAMNDGEECARLQRALQQATTDLNAAREHGAAAVSAVGVSIALQKLGAAFQAYAAVQKLT